MIEGLHYDFGAHQLHKHLTERAEFHRDRGKFYRAEADGLVASGHTDDRVSGGGPVAQLNRKAVEHENRAAEFVVMAAHLEMSEVYRLDHADMVRVGILSHSY